MRVTRWMVAGMALAVCAASALAGELGVGLSAPPIKVAKWIKGKPVKLDAGKLNVVEFWATWCGPCKVSIPHLTELQKKYGDKVTFTGVSIWEEPEATDNSYLTKVESFVKEWGPKMDYRVAADGYEGTMAKTWMEAAEGNGIPTAFIVSGEGKVLWIGHPMAGLDTAIDQILGGKYDLAAAAAQDKQRREMAKAQREMFGPIQDAMKSGDTKAAIAAIDDAIAKDPKMIGSLGMTKFNILLKSDTPGAMAWAKELADGVYKNNAQMLNNLAWPMVDDKSVAKNPDYALAVKIAERGVGLLKDADPFAPYILDTLAYAYYKNGQLDKALETQGKAVSAAESLTEFDAATLKEIRERMDMFKEKKKAAGGGG